MAFGFAFLKVESFIFFRGSAKNNLPIFMAPFHYRGVASSVTTRCVAPSLRLTIAKTSSEKLGYPIYFRTPKVN